MSNTSPVCKVTLTLTPSGDVSTTVYSGFFMPYIVPHPGERNALLMMMISLAEQRQLDADEHKTGLQ